MTQGHSSLLPNGLKDLLPFEAEKESFIINLLMQEFSKFGYARVKPPLVEFEESLLASGVGKTLRHNTFRLMDPVSHRMMGVRADTTAQIARIAKTRMSDEPRPLRLCYATDVLKVNSSQLRPERQFCQVGCEMIGGEDDVEICLTALSSINKLGIENLSIDLAIPVLVDTLFEAFDVTADTQEILNKLLQKRDRDGLVEIGSDITKTLISLLDASGIASKAIENLQKIDIPVPAQKNISKLQKLYKELEAALKIYGLEEINITIDFIERRGFDYKSGVSFTLFSSKARGELGRGGRYHISDKEEAIGFTLYMDSILRTALIHPDKKEKVVGFDSSWENIKKLQEAGYQVSRQKEVKEKK